jgi:hypothetical protein
VTAGNGRTQQIADPCESLKLPKSSVATRVADDGSINPAIIYAAFSRVNNNAYAGSSFCSILNERRLIIKPNILYISTSLR